MKRFIFLLTIFTWSNIYAQVFPWNFRSIFPKGGVTAGDTLMKANVHGLVVDPDGKIWVQDYYAYARDSVLIPNYFTSGKDTSHVDSVKKYTISRWTAVRALYCFYPNGTQPTWSPLKWVTINGKNDTLGGESFVIKGLPVWHSSASVKTGRGLATDHNGNILASYGAFIFRINYKTSAGMGRLDTDPLLALNLKNSIIAPAVDTNGNIFVHRVVNANQPIKIYDKDFNFIGNVVDTVTKATGFSRGIGVSKNGNDVYYSSYEHSYTLRFHSDNGILGPYAFKDTLFKGLSIETFTWNKKTGHLWISSGSYLSLPNRHWTKTYWSNATWYAFDVTTMAVKDSLRWWFAKSNSANERPRGFGFNPTSDTVYAGVFGDFAVPGVRTFSFGPMKVKPIEGIVATDFRLEQNYPNPFNPTTQIKFTVAKNGITTLKVYDLLGKEVATLVNENLSVGAYSIKFDGSKLTSGTYLYILSSNGKRMANKMMLIK
mgnify:FL=1